MTAEEFAEVLSQALEPVITQQQNIKEVCALLVVCVGVVVGVLLVTLLWRRF